MKGPRVAYLTLWTLESGRIMPAITSAKTFEDWQKQPEEYRRKRISRFNTKKVGRLNARATDFHVERYYREDVQADANIAQARASGVHEGYSRAQSRPGDGDMGG